MDIGKLKNNDKFYEGFEDDHEITLSYVEDPEYNIHIYEGYFSDFFGDPPLDGKGWSGFTRDYQQMERTFGDVDYTITDIKEYLDDLLTYADKEYDYEDTAECFNLLKDFLEYAQESKYRILVHYF